MVIGWGVLHTEMNENVSICPDGGRSFFEGVGGNDMGAWYFHGGVKLSSCPFGDNKERRRRLGRVGNKSLLSDAIVTRVIQAGDECSTTRKTKKKERGSDRPSALQQQRRRRRYTNAIESEKSFPFWAAQFRLVLGNLWDDCKMGVRSALLGCCCRRHWGPTRQHTNINRLNSFLCYVMGGQSPYKMTIPNYKFSSVFALASSCTSL